MRSYRLTRPHRAHFFRRVVADCKDKIEFRRTWFGEFSPIFAAQAIGRQFCGFDLARRGGMDFTFRVATGAVRRERRESVFVHDGFGHDGTSGVTRAEKQYVVSAWHGGLASIATRRAAAGFSAGVWL